MDIRLNKSLKNIIKSSFLISIYTANIYAINGVYDYGYGEITRGMGGAGIAMPEDGSVAITNPAGIAVYKHNIDAGVAVYFPDMYAKYGPGTSSFPLSPIAAAQGTFDTKQKVFVLPGLAYTYHYDKKNHFAFSANAVGGFGTRYTTDKTASVSGAPGPATLQRGVLGNGTIISSLKVGSINGTYSYLFNPNFSLGLSLRYYIQAFESAGSQGLAAFTQTFRNSGGAVTPTKLSNNGVDYNYGVGFTAGFWARVHPKVAIAGSASPKVHMSKFDKYKDLFVNRGELDVPGRYAFGVNYKHNDQLDINVDFVRIMNEDDDNYRNNSQALFNGQCIANSSFCFGGKNGPGFGWENQNILKVGGAYKITSKDTIRLGVSYSNRIAHAEDIVVTTLAPGAAARWITSAGYSRQMSTYKINSFLTFIPSQSMSGKNLLSVGGLQEVKTKVSGIGIGLGISA